MKVLKKANPVTYMTNIDLKLKMVKENHMYNFRDIPELFPGDELKIEGHNNQTIAVYKCNEHGIWQSHPDTIGETVLELKTGYITYYTMGQQTDPNILKNGLKNLGYDGYTLNPRSWLLSLKAALSERYKETLVRSLKKREDNGYTVVKEVKGYDENKYPRLFNAQVSESGIVTCVHAGPEVDVKKIQERTDHFRSVLPGDTVSKVLVDILQNDLNGTSMRDGGCIYFVPNESIDKWRAVCDVVQSAAVGGTFNKTTCNKMERSDDTLRDIRDSIIDEVKRDTEIIRSELKENDLGKRAITNRVNRSVEIAKRVQFYENVLGEALDECRGALAETSQAAAFATAQQENQDVFDDLFEADTTGV